MRKLTKEIKVGDISIGGNAPISIQSMTNTDTRDISSTVSQIYRLQDVGCELVRVAVPDMEAAYAINKIKAKISIPLIADIHFDYRLAIESIKNGADKIRINPGNIGEFDRIKKVVKEAKERNIPIRIGVNSGSIERDILNKYSSITPEGLVESAECNVKLIESMDYYNIVVSIKASSVPYTIKAYRMIAERISYPLHIGITEAGTVFTGTIKSAIGLGILIFDGIGDTLRVSLTGDPVEEVKVATEMLKALEIRHRGVNLVSCPTCGRCKVNLIDIANRVEKALSGIQRPIKVAVMGCAVNGPGEAKDADIGVACGDGCGLIFKKGKIIRKVLEKDIVTDLIKEIEKGV